MEKQHSATPLLNTFSDASDINIQQERFFPPHVRLKYSTGDTPLPSSHFRFWRLSMESVPLEVIGEEIGCKIEQGKMDICVYISAS